MRILHVITTLDRGGAEAHLVDLIKRQLKAGHAVACGYLKGPGYWAPTLIEAGAEVQALRLSAYGDPGPVWRLRRLARSFGAEVAHLHLQPSELYGAAAFGGGALPIVSSRHNLGRFYKGPASAALERWAVARSSRVIAISHAAAARVREVSPARPDKRLGVIPYGVDLAPHDRDAGSARARLRAEWGLPPDAFVFGTVSRLIESKRVDVLIDALALLRAERLSCDARLVVVGDGSERAGLEARAKHKGVADAVVFAGLRNDVPDCLTALDAFVFASVTEGFGLVLLEAMAARLPVIATGIPPMTDIVREGETGLTTLVADAASNAQAMGRLLDDPGLRTRLAAAGRACAETHSLDVMAARIEAVYREAMTERR
ncbi:MAG: glycosyltransferase [Proteobacteria bacterium]|nr:glycosyltransferase [Pseudomonadota bacterium]